MKKLLALIAVITITSCAHVPRSYDINFSELQGQTYLLEVLDIPAFSISEKTLGSALISSANKVAINKHVSDQFKVANSYEAPVGEDYLDKVYSALEKQYESKLGFTEAKDNSYNYVLEASITDIGLKDTSIIDTKFKMHFGVKFWLTDRENKKFESFGSCSIWSEEKYTVEEATDNDLQLFKEFLDSNLDKCIEKSIKRLDYAIKKDKRKDWSK